MQGRQRNGIFSAVGIQGPELAQPSLTPLSDRGLRHQPAEDQLPGRIKPVSRQGSDHVPPDAALQGIKAFRRLRTALAGHHGDDGQRRLGFAATSHRGCPER